MSATIRKNQFSSLTRCEITQTNRDGQEIERGYFQMHSGCFEARIISASGKAHQSLSLSIEETDALIDMLVAVRDAHKRAA